MPRTAASFTYPAQAIVLRARPLGEKDRALTLFCREKGRLSAVAKGARGTKSKLAALSQPFVQARFLLASGRSLDIVSQAQIEDAHSSLVGDIYKTAWASFACEVVDSLPEGLPDEVGFDILSLTLAALNTAQNNQAVEAAGLWFETQWLVHQGYMPTIGTCVACEEKIAVSERENPLLYAPNLGGTLCEKCRLAEPGAERVTPQSLRAFHRLARSRRAPDDLTAPPFELDFAQIAQLGFCVRKTLLAHAGARFKATELLEELRGELRVRDL